MKAFRLAWEDALCGAKMDPRQAAWITDLLLTLIRSCLAGKRIPSMKWFTLQDEEAEAAALIHLGGLAVAKRQKVHRSTAYRRAHKHRDAS